MLHVELPHEVKMSDDVEVEVCDHIALLLVIRTNERLGAAAEMIADPVRQQFRHMIDRHARAIRCHDPVNRADDVVRRDRRIRRPIGSRSARHIIGLDAAKNPDLILEVFRKRANLRHVPRSLLGRQHPVRIALRQHRMRGKANDLESLRHRRLNHLPRRLLAVAPGRMCMIVSFDH